MEVYPFALVWHNFLVKSLPFEQANVTFSSIFLVLIIIIAIFLFFYFKPKSKMIYLVDYACFKPPFTMRVPFASFIEHTRLVYKDNPKAARFQMRILERAGLGEETSLPPAIHYIPPDPTLGHARDEAHLVIFSAIDELFTKTKLRPEDVEILITNCTTFCPSPSLSSMIINKYKMSSAIKAFSLSGMGCSASPISVDLATKILQVRPNSYALVVSTEIITPNCYMGSDQSMLVPSCLFRMGCTAILLTNKQAERNRAKYKLLHVVRTNKSAIDEAYNTVTQKEDSEGKLGVVLSKELLVTASETLKANVTTLGRLVLPINEKVRFALNLIARKIFKFTKLKPYVPNFNKVFNHFCIHAGGPAVIDKIQKAFQLLAHQEEASRMALHRFGNTSSSSIWYVLSYIEAKGRMKRGDLVWQIALGAGFKCNSVIWKCHRDIKVETDGHGPWKDSIGRYPVYIPDVLKL